MERKSISGNVVRPQHNSFYIESKPTIEQKIYRATLLSLSPDRFKSNDSEKAKKDKAETKLS